MDIALQFLLLIGCIWQSGLKAGLIIKGKGSYLLVSSYLVQHLKVGCDGFY